MRKTLGFTLIELMIVVAIVAVLALIAYPSYVEQIRKSRRAQAKADLVELTQVLERKFTTDRKYEGFELSSPLDVSPHTGKVWYNIVLAPLTATTYTLTATPIDDQVKDKCGTLTIDQAGTKTPSLADCW